MKNYLFLIIFVSVISVTAQTSCCDDVACNEQAQRFVNQFVPAFQRLGAFPSDVNQLPTFEKINGEWILQVEGMSDQRIRDVRDAIYWVHQLKGQKEHRAKCILSKIEDLDVIQWWTYLNSHYTGNTNLPSPHFYKATYVTLNLRPFGAMKPWSRDEGYSSSYDLTIGRTFARKDPLKDRRIKWNLGAKWLHQYDNGDLTGLIELDWKLSDVKVADLFNVGYFKMHFQGYGNGDVIGGETGLSFESYGFGLNVITLGYQDYYNIKGVYFQSGLIIMPFELAKFFKK